MLFKNSKNSKNIENSSYRIQKVQKNPEIVLTKYKNTLDKSKIVLTE